MGIMNWLALAGRVVKSRQAIIAGVAAAILVAVPAAVLLSSTLSCRRSVDEFDVVLADGTKRSIHKREMLRVMSISEPPTLDWHKASDHLAVVTDNFMEGLIQYSYRGKELELQAGLAEKWESENGGRVWKVRLRPGVKWSDGAEFTAQHVLDGFERLLAKETASPYAQFLANVQNALKFNSGAVAFGDVGIKITGPRELTFRLNASMADFPFLLTHPSTYPIRKDVVAKYGDRWTDPGKIVTLGPYVLRDWQHDRIIWLERNELYYGEKPQIANILVHVIPELTTAVNLFESGVLDAVHNVPSLEARRFKGKSELREVGTLSIYYYGFNTKIAPTDNVNFRKAIASAIDRQPIVKLLGGEQLPLRSWVPPGVLGYNTQLGLPFHVERAKEFLRLAGYDGKVRPPKIVLTFNATDDNKRIGENLQAQLKANLGIDVELKSEEWKVYLESIRNSPPQMFRLSWNADYPDPNNFFSVLMGGQATNRTGWKNVRYDQLVLKASEELDRDQRLAAYADAHRIVLEDEVPVIPLFSGVHQLLVSERVEMYPVNALLRYPYSKTRLKP